MARIAIVVGALVALALGIAACGDDESGICIADMGIVVECFDCWDQETCEEASNRTWNTDFDSCPDAGYTNSTSNACGYTR